MEAPTPAGRSASFAAWTTLQPPVQVLQDDACVVFALG